MFVVVALTTLTAVIVGYFYRKYARLIKLSRNFPGPSPLPLLGNAHMFIGKEPDEYIMVMQDVMNRYGETVKIWLGPEFNILTQNLKLVEAVLGGVKHIEKAGEYKVLEPWLREGLLISKGKKWFQRRKIITPAFHFKILEQFVEVFDSQGNVLIDKLKQFKAEDEVDLYHFCTLYALDVICETAMGVTANAQLDSDSNYVQAVKTISQVLHKRMFDLKYRFDIIYKWTSLARLERKALDVLHGFSEDVIVSRRDELVKAQQNNNEIIDDNENVIGEKRKMAFLDILLQSSIDGKPLSNLDIREEVDTFMFEGHDTTTSAIAFCFYNLGMHPKTQTKCYEEICEIIGTDRSRPVTIADLNKLHYVELCIKETLRLFPSVPLLGRKVVEECVIGGMRIPAGTNIGISPLGLGRDENIFEKANDFIPERFEEAIGGDKLNPYAFIPFSAGPRNCIGQKFAMLEVKSIVSKVLRNFEVDVVNKTELPVVVAELILRPKHAIKFRIKPRN